MARGEGPGCSNGHHGAFQRRIYHRRMTYRGQRFLPLGWLCYECGVVDYDEDVEEEYVPLPERKRRQSR